MFNNKKKIQTVQQQKQARRNKIASEYGALKKQDNSLGTTGIATQPIAPKIDRQVYRRLHDGYPQLLNDSIKHPVLNKQIKHLIVANPHFSNLPTYGRPVIADEVLIDVSGLGPLQRLFKIHPDITDAGYDGHRLWYKTNDTVCCYGNQPGEDASLYDWSKPSGKNRVSMLLHKFCYNDQNDASLNPAHPLFDGEYNFGGPKDPSLRVSATDATLTPLGSGPTFSVRMSVPHLALKKSNFKYNSPLFVYNVLNVLMKANANILISGITGSGKTELQKMMVGFIQPRDKIIMIEDTPETHLHEIYPTKDILDWCTNAQANLAKLVAESLRNDADWCMVSETRGGEAYQMFQSVKTGHHITTTLHASSNVAVPSRFAGMCEEAKGIDVDEDALVRDFVDFMQIGIHTNSKVIGGHTYRYIDNLSEFVPYTYKTKEKVVAKTKDGQVIKNKVGDPLIQMKDVTHHTNGTHPLFVQALEDHNGTCIRHWRTFKPTHFICELVKRVLDTQFVMPHQNENYDHKEIVPNPKAN